MGLVIAGCLAAAGVSCAFAPPAPDYDPWAWLIWGRELGGLQLSTAEGPAFKPLPVAVSVLLAPLGEAAPSAWVILARAGALLAVVLAFAAGRRIGGWAGGLGAAVGVVATGGFVAEAAPGNAEGLLLALALAAWLCGSTGHPHVAFALAVGCALVRVEAWPFALAAAAFAWRRRPADRPLLAAAVVAVPALWLGPELMGSGELLRSAGRARAVEPGQPGLAALPVWDSLRQGAGLVSLLLAPGLGVLVATHRTTGAREGLVLAATGVAWLALVAVMAQLGFSGEERYALPGAALIGLSGGAGLGLGARRALSAGGPASARRRGRCGRTLVRLALPGACLLLAGAVALRADPPADVRAGQVWRAQLGRDLERAVRRAGGADRLLGCGRPYVGRFRGTLLAYRLGVAKHRVGLTPRVPGVVFRSRLGPGHAVRPRRPSGFRTLASSGSWQLAARCASDRS